MKSACSFLFLILSVVLSANGQNLRSMDSALDGFTQSNTQKSKSDTVSSSKKEIPKGVKVWTVDRRFGDIINQPMDTVSHMFPNTVFTAGLRGEYNFLGNLGSPRQNRIFTKRKKDDGDFLFTQPYDYFALQPDEFLFVNTLSPYANLSYYTCGNRTNGEDHFTAKYSINAGKKLGFGFRINYLYGRGYYSEQSTSLFDVNLFGSYIGDQYQAHLLLTTNHQKITENGGITNDNFITHPETISESYASNEIPTLLSSNWNRNKNYKAFLSHRYNIGFHRKVKMTAEEIAARKFAMESQNDNMHDESRHRHENDESAPRRNNTGRPDNAKVMGDDIMRNDSTNIDYNRQTMDIATADSLLNAQNIAAKDTAWMKTEYVPVTSFIHTAQLGTYERIYQAKESPSNYYANEYYDASVTPDATIFDTTKSYRIRNTFAMSLLEGFNKWAFAGIKLFAASDLRSYTLPDIYNALNKYTTHNFSIGGQMARTQGKAFHYRVQAETWLLGDDQGQVKIDGGLDLNFPLFGDTVTLAAKAFFYNEQPNYYLRHFHSRHFWWDDDLSKSTHTNISGELSYQKTRTSISIAADELTNYTYIGTSYSTGTDLTRSAHSAAVRQSSDAITVITAALKQDFTFGPLNWENVITYQKSTNENIIPVPALNIYTNMYLKFRIAKVLSTEFGADCRYFTEYAAPEYVPGIGQFAIQENADKIKIGNYPIVNIYANFNLKGTRFFVMYSHANAGMGNKNQFYTPHYPTNTSVLRFGISWNFFN